MPASETETEGHEAEAKRDSSAMSSTDTTAAKNGHENGEVNVSPPEKNESKVKDMEKAETPDKGKDLGAKGDGEEAVVDPNIVDWDGPDDPANPRNWSKARKMLNVSLVSLSVYYSYVQPNPRHSQSQSRIPNV